MKKRGSGHGSDGKVGAGAEGYFDLRVSKVASVSSAIPFRLWQSIRQFRKHYGYDAIEVTIAKARIKFMESLRFHDNYVLRLLATLDT